MTNEQALKKAVDLICPYYPNAGWNFESNIKHLNTITKYISKTAIIFDAGCGWGILALALIFLGYKVEGADKSFPENVKKIWNEYGLKVKNLDILKDEISGEYGAVISIATIEHQTTPGFFLNRLKKIIKKDGYIYMATPNLTHLLNRIRFLFGLSPLGNLEEFLRENNFEGHVREYTLDEFKKIFKWSGLKIIKAENRQELKPKIDLRNFRNIYVNLFRLLAYFIPGAGDANIILGQK